MSWRQLLLDSGYDVDVHPFPGLMGSGIYNPIAFDGATNEAKIQAAITACAAAGKKLVIIPLSWAVSGFTTSSVTFNSAVRMIVEGLDPTVYHVAGYGAPLVGVAAGATAISISNAVKQALRAAADNGGGIVSFLGQTGEFGFTSDAWSILTKLDIAPIDIHWGTAVYRLANKQAFLSHHHHILHNTRFVMQNLDASRWTGAYAFLNTGQGMQLATTVGSGTVTLASGYASDGTASTLFPGQQLSIFGHVPRAGRDNTTLTADPGAGGTTLAVVSTAAYASSGWLALPNNAGTDYEIVRYTSKDATNFLSCTRGYGGTTAVAHNIGTAVDRAVYEPYQIKSISGNTITLDEGRTVPFTSTTIDAFTGAFQASLEGIGEIDGNMDPGVDDGNNPAGCYVLYASRCYWGPGITYRNWDHSGIILNQSCHNIVRGKIIDSTRPSLQLGSATWLFGSSRHNDLEIQVENCYIGCYIDSRTTTAGVFDGPCDNNRVVVTMARAVYNPIRISGSRDNYCLVESAVDLPATGIGITEDGDGQWVTTANAQGLAYGNVLEVKTVDGTAGFLGVNCGSAFGGQRNLIICQRPNTPVNIPAGTIIGFVGPKGSVSLTYGATVNTDALSGDHFEIIVTNGTAWALANPTNAVEGHEIEYDIYNNSGGAMGAVTPGADFNLAGAFVAPANTQRRMYRFRRRNGKWRETCRTAADQAN